MIKRDYRIVKDSKKFAKGDDSFLELREVYYGEENMPYLPESPTPVDETARWEVRSKIRAFEKPILLLEDGELIELNEYFEE